MEANVSLAAHPGAHSEMDPLSCNHAREDGQDTRNGIIALSRIDSFSA